MEILTVDWHVIWTYFEFFAFHSSDILSILSRCARDKIHKTENILNDKKQQQQINRVKECRKIVYDEKIFVTLAFLHNKLELNFNTSTFFVLIMWVKLNLHRVIETSTYAERPKKRKISDLVSQKLSNKPIEKCKRQSIFWFKKFKTYIKVYNLKFCRSNNNSYNLTISQKHFWLSIYSNSL